MNTSYHLFKSLHEQKEPLLIGNVWNVQSAKVLENLHFKAIGTSSAAVAETLGYSDGEQMTFDEYIFIIKRIKASTTLPLTVDLEAGYGKTAEKIVGRLGHLHAIGVAGINIEDSIVENGKRSIVDATHFANKLRDIVTSLNENKIQLFINVRCDAFLLELAKAKDEAIKRIKLYEATGVDGIFLPCITDVNDIKETTNAISLPMNVMCMPNFPNFNQLKTLGVKRISMGNFANGILYKKMETMCSQIVKEQSFYSLFKS